MNDTGTTTLFNLYSLNKPDIIVVEKKMVVIREAVAKEPLTENDRRSIRQSGALRNKALCLTHSQYGGI